MRKRLIYGFAALIATLLVGLLQLTTAQSAVVPATSDNYGDRLYHSHQGDLPIASAAVEMQPTVPVMTEAVEYGTIGDRTTTGYLAYPEDRASDLPGLIVIHEWWGLNDNIKMMTERLAGEGYVALAVDLYAGDTAETPDRALELVGQAVENAPLLQENLKQAFAYLEAEQNTPTIGSIGWCFGGSWSLYTALALPEELDAAVIYYGGQITTDPNQLNTLQMPILGIFGRLDDNPSPETALEFESVLDELGKDADIYIYPDADHAFANPSGTRYNPEAAEDAWQRTIAFLNQHL